jgi:hypothetical protein
MDQATFSAEMRRARAGFRDSPHPAAGGPTVMWDLAPPPAALRPDGVDNVVAGYQARLGAIQQVTDTELAQAKASVTAGATADFRARMEALKAKAKAESDKALDDAYAQLDTIGAQHPEARPLIVQATQKMVALTAQTLQTVNSSVDSVIGYANWTADQLAKGVGTVVGGITTAGKTIGSGLETAGHAVASIFSGW